MNFPVAKGAKVGGSTVHKARENRGQMRLLPREMELPPRPALTRTARLTINSIDFRKSPYRQTLIVGIREIALFAGVVVEVVKDPHWMLTPELDDRGRKIHGLDKICEYWIQQTGAYFRMHRLGIHK